MGQRLRRMRRTILGKSPWAVLLFITPTLLAIALDFVLRAPSLLVFPPREWLNYFGSSLASAGFWGGPLWLTSRLWPARRAGRPGSPSSSSGRCSCCRSPPSRSAGRSSTTASFTTTWGATRCASASRCAARSARGCRRGARRWGSWSATGARWRASSSCSRRGARRGRRARRWTLAAHRRLRRGARVLLGRLRRVALAAGRAARHLLHPRRDARAARRGHGQGLGAARHLACASPTRCRRCIDARAAAARASCSSSPRACAPTPCARRPPLGCKARFLDEVAPDRIALGKLTTQSSGTFSSCVMLWTGLAPDADFRTMHHAAVLWEVARTLGYRTAYIGSQNLRYDDFGAFLAARGIDVQASAKDLGNAPGPARGRARRERDGAHARVRARRARRARRTSRCCTCRTPTGPTASPGSAALRAARRLARGRHRGAPQPLLEQRPACRSARWPTSCTSCARCPAGTTRSCSSSPTTASSSASTGACTTSLRSSTSRCACPGGSSPATTRSTPRSARR